MNISGIRSKAGFYDYNAIRLNKLRSKQISEARALGLDDIEDEGEVILPVSISKAKEEQKCILQERHQAEQQQAEQQGRQQEEQQVVQQKRQQEQKCEPSETQEVAKDLKLQEINRERVSAEIEKALSDVKRDEVLMQYQFFVGEKDFRTALQREKNGENEGFRL